MDVSFSAWRHSREESLQLKGDSFSFLFDRRYTNRLNRMSRVFFEAYVVATKELAAQEDRFPSLSEIDAKMESGAVYAFKDRLMKNTEFFEEVKISGVSYLVPRALKFVDASRHLHRFDLELRGGHSGAAHAKEDALASEIAAMPIRRRRARTLTEPETVAANAAHYCRRYQSDKASQRQNLNRILMHTPEAIRGRSEPGMTTAAAAPSQPSLRIKDR